MTPTDDSVILRPCGSSPSADDPPAEDETGQDQPLVAVSYWEDLGLLKMSWTQVGGCAPRVALRAEDCRRLSVHVMPGGSSYTLCLLYQQNWKNYSRVEDATPPCD